MEGREQGQGGIDGFGGQGRFVETAGEDVGHAAKGGLHAGDLRSVGADEGSILGQPLSGVRF